MSKKFFIEFENYSGLKVPLSHKLYESAEAASNDAIKYIANGNYKSFSIIEESAKPKKENKKPNKTEKPVNEGVLDSVDDDGWMAKSELYTLAKQAIELHRMINDTDQLDPWMQSKISRAKAYITSVKEHLDYRTHGMDVDTPAIPDTIDHDMFFENEDFSKMSDSKLEAWVKLNDTEDANPSFKKKLKKAKEELSSRQTNESEDPCWKGYKMVGTKKKGKKKVPNCVPESKITEHENYENYVNDLRKKGFSVYVSQEQSDAGWTFEVERNGKSVTIIEPESGSYYIQHETMSGNLGKKYPSLKDAVRAAFKGKVSETTSSGGIAAVSQPLGTPAKRLKSKKKR